MKKLLLSIALVLLPLQALAVIHIVSAKWGQHGGSSCDATSVMVAACENKTRCQVYAGATTMCNDPYQGWKEAEVTYTCDGVQDTYAWAEGAQIVLPRNPGSDGTLNCSASATPAPTPTSSKTIIPESGSWWNPSASGSGYNIEIQNNILTFTAYVYDAAGAPTFYISVGTLSGDRSYNGTLVRVSNGQCIGCAYRTPISANVGTVIIEFENATNARLILNGGSAIPIQRFAYGINLNAPYSMLGEWALVSGSASAVYAGDRVGFSSTQTLSGTLAAVGSRTGATDRVAVAYLDVASGAIAVLVDSSSPNYDLYIFNFAGLSVIEGNYWTFLKTGAPTGTGNRFIGFRSKSASLVATGSGPGLSSGIDHSLASAAELPTANMPGQELQRSIGFPPAPSLVQAEDLLQKLQVVMEKY